MVVTLVGEKDENSTLNVSAAVFTLLVLLIVILFYLALPQPISNIPHNSDSAHRLLGDGPLLATTPRVRTWLRDQFHKHNSPIVQVFPAPFSKPWVLVSDHREAMDVMMRRTHEFDRSKLTIESFGGVLGNSHICMRTEDSRFKQNQALLKDLRTKSFLNEIAAPELYEKVSSVLDLWSLKTNLGKGHPFRADQDIYKLTLDFTMAVLLDFPSHEAMLVKQIAHLKSLKQTQNDEALELKADEPATFEDLPLEPELEACVYLSESIGLSFESAFPRLANWMYLRKKESRRRLALKNGLISRNINAARQRIESQDTSHPFEQKRRGVDQILLREKEAAVKEDRKPDFHKKVIYDEIFALVVGGHDTTSTVLQWFVKYIAIYQPVQTRLRESLRSAHKLAHNERRLPTTEEIRKNYVPYLEAVIEETLRFSHIVPIILREAIVDAHLLGYPIPKGTQVWFLSNGPSYVEPAFDVAESKRSEGESRSAVRCGVWAASDVREFKPERFLAMAPIPYEKPMTEKEVYLPLSGPNLPFGAGRRGCFGRNLAWLEMRIVITLLVWYFEFLHVGEKLGGMDVIDRATEVPRNCYVMLKKIEL